MVKLTEDERTALKTLISERTNFAALNLDKSCARYAEACKQQEDSVKTADEILKKLSTDDRRTVLRHYEGEVHKFSFETDAAYVQGIRDCVKALMFFGVFGACNERK